MLGDGGTQPFRGPSPTVPLRTYFSSPYQPKKDCCSSLRTSPPSENLKSEKTFLEFHLNEKEITFLVILAEKGMLPAQHVYKWL